MTPIQYQESNKDRFLSELLDLLKIPSVSADSKFTGDVRKAAQFLVDRFKEMDAEKVALYETGGHPIIYAEKIVDEKLPTVLVYGHYDVQPADPYELWDSPPFEPVIKDERI